MKRGNGPLIVFVLFGIPFTLANPMVRLHHALGEFSDRDIPYPSLLQFSSVFGTLAMMLSTLWHLGFDIRLSRWYRPTSANDDVEQVPLIDKADT